MLEERIGIFGGTFNPIHLGHLRAAEEVRIKCKLNKILFIPSFIPPHKENRDIAPPEARWKMVCLGIEGNDYFIPSKIEMEEKRKSYSIYTLRRLKKKYSSSMLFFIMGVDSFLEIKTWKKYYELLKNYFIIVISRPGFNLKDSENAIPREFRSNMRLFKNYDDFNREILNPPCIFLLQIKTLDISSTEIRTMIKRNESIKYLVPVEVENYIMKNRLYRG